MSRTLNEILPKLKELVDGAKEAFPTSEGYNLWLSPALADMFNATTTEPEDMGKQRWNECNV